MISSISTEEVPGSSLIVAWRYRWDKTQSLSWAKLRRSAPASWTRLLATLTLPGLNRNWLNWKWPEQCYLACRTVLSASLTTAYRKNPIHGIITLSSVCTRHYPLHCTEELRHFIQQRWFSYDFPQEFYDCRGYESLRSRLSGARTKMISSNIRSTSIRLHWITRFIQIKHARECI